MDNITEQDGENGFNLHQKIAGIELQRRKLLGQNIALLRVMKDKGLYRAVLGDEGAKWEAYLGQVEVFYSRNDVYNLMRIHEKFVTELGYEYETISDIPKSRLVEVLPVVTKHNIELLLSQARELTSRDFTDVVRDLKGLPTIDDGHEHEFVEYEICSICGEKHRKENHYETEK